MNPTSSTSTWHAARRRLLRLIGAIGGSSVLVASRGASAGQPASAEVRKTPADTEGPFYPVEWSGDVDDNLLKLADGTLYQNGSELLVQGQVLRPNGKPATSARVEIWQCDFKGRYRHPRDAGEAPAQDGFQGYGWTTTDADGRYRFFTIKPVAYGGRPPHIHFRIKDESATLTTQMYFEGENQEQSRLSRFFGFASERELLTVKPEPSNASLRGGEGLQVQFNVYL